MDMEITSTDVVRMVIERARFYIADEGRWICGQRAATKDGARTDVGDPNAHRFCAAGAIDRAFYFDMAAQSVIKRRLVYDALAVEPTSLVRINDCEGREAVLALFDAWLERNPS